MLEATLESRNLLLEPITTKHAAKLFSSFQDKNLYNFIPHEPPSSIKALEKRYSNWQKRHSEDKKEIWLNYALFHKNIENYVGTVQATVQDNGIAYIAYEVFSPLWRQGIAKEACLLLIKTLFENFNTTCVLAHADTRNTASIKLLESLKFNLERKIVKADYFKGVYSDELVYRLNFEQFENLR